MFHRTIIHNKYNKKNELENLSPETIRKINQGLLNTREGRITRFINGYFNDAHSVNGSDEND